MVIGLAICYYGTAISSATTKRAVREFSETLTKSTELNTIRNAIRKVAEGTGKSKLAGYYASYGTTTFLLGLGIFVVARQFKWNGIKNTETN